MGREGEPWHVGGAGGLLRSIVYGFNDGLTANFGLVAGVVGANLGAHVVIVTGVAGAIADALSMGSSGYLAAKSEAEVQAHQIEMERQEMRLMPDLEEEELALIYEAKGMPRDSAREMAKTMMLDPVRALETQVREELNIHPAELAPLKDGLVTGTATAVGAFIPIAAVPGHGPRPGGVGVAGDQHGGALRDRRGAQPVHRPRNLGQRPRHVRGRLRRRRRRLPHRGVAAADSVVGRSRSSSTFCRLRTATGASVCA